MDLAFEDAEKSHRLWKIYRTLQTMLNDRGFVAPDEGITLDAFKLKFGDSPSSGRPRRRDFNAEYESKTDPNVKLGVYYHDEDGAAKAGVAAVRLFTQYHEGKNLKYSIIIIPGSLTPTAKKALNEFAASSKGSTIQLFEETQLVVNVTEHVLVPKHVPLNEEGKRALLERYKLKEHQLPRLKLTDPIAQYFGLQRGQVVKIERPSPTAGRYITYRIVF